MSIQSDVHLVRTYGEWLNAMEAEAPSRDATIQIDTTDGVSYDLRAVTVTDGVITLWDSADEAIDWIEARTERAAERRRAAKEAQCSSAPSAT